MKVKPQIITIDIGQKENQTAWVILGELGVRDLDIRVVQNGRPFDISGIHMSLYAKTPLDNTIFNTIDIVDAKRGKGFVTIPEQISSQVGKSKCCITFIKDGKMMLSFDFVIKIQDSIFSDRAIVASDEFGSLVDALSGVADLEGNYVPRLTQLENGKTDKTTTADLSKRVDGAYSQLAEIINNEYQEDYVETISRIKYYDKMSVILTDTTKNIYSIILKSKNNQGIQYDITPRENSGVTDDMILLDGGYIGDYVESYTETYNKPTLSGNWTTDYKPNIYTTNIGDSFEITVEGEIIEFNYMSDNRGGIMEIDFNGEKIFTISTWSKSNEDKKIILYNGVNATRTIKGTFKGKDPQREPTGGVARGWIKYNDSGNINTITCKSDKLIKLENKQEFLAKGSNKEVAIYSKPSSFSGGCEWIPMHSNFKATDMVARNIFIDGIDKSSYNTKKVENIEQFKIVQVLKGNFKTQKNVSEIAITTTFNKNGSVEIDGSYEFLVDTFAQGGYLGMFPFHYNPFTEIINSIGGNYLTKKDGSRTTILERDKTNSYCAVTNNNKNICCAYTIKKPNFTFRKGDITPYVFLDNRQDFTKLYVQSFENENIKANTKMVFGSKFAVGSVDSIYRLIKK